MRPARNGPWFRRVVAVLGTAGTTARPWARRDRDREAGARAHRRVPPVAAHHEIGADLERALRRRDLHARRYGLALDEPGRLGAHAEVETGIARALLRQKIEEVPLRHERDELAARRQVARSRRWALPVANLALKLSSSFVRQREEVVEQAELVHDLERRGMDGVAAEVTQKVGVLLEDDDVHAGAGEQEARASCRPARRRRCSSGWKFAQPLSLRMLGCA